MEGRSRCGRSNKALSMPEALEAVKALQGLAKALVLSLVAPSGHIFDQKQD
jgi:hypothetical protein